jgi:hypothetical protein
MTHALPTESLLLSVVLPARVSQALPVQTRRFAPGLLRRRLRAPRRAVQVPAVTRAAEQELPVAPGAGTSSQLLHETPSPAPNWTQDRRAWHPRCRARRFHVVPCAAELELRVAPLWGGAYATTTSSAARPRNRQRRPASSRARHARDPALLDARFHSCTLREARGRSC